MDSNLARLTELSVMIKKIMGTADNWPMVETQPLTTRFLAQLRSANNHTGGLFVIGADVADYVRHRHSDEFVKENGYDARPLDGFLEVISKRSGRASGFVGLLTGCEVWAHADVAPNMFMLLVPGNEPKAVIGYVKI
jgi:hypothetical protein